MQNLPAAANSHKSKKRNHWVYSDFFESLFQLADGGSRIFRLFRFPIDHKCFLLWLLLINLGWHFAASLCDPNQYQMSWTWGKLGKNKNKVALLKFLKTFSRACLAQADGCPEKEWKFARANTLTVTQWSKKANNNVRHKVVAQWCQSLLMLMLMLIVGVCGSFLHFLFLGFVFYVFALPWVFLKGGLQQFWLELGTRDPKLRPAALQDRILKVLFWQFSQRWVLLLSVSAALHPARDEQQLPGLFFLNYAAS